MEKEIEEKEYYYRLENARENLYLRKFPVVSKTRCGVWIDVYPDKIKKKFVLNGTRKKFACKTIEGAIESFIARKEKQLKIMKGYMENIELTLIKVANKDWFEEDNYS